MSTYLKRSNCLAIFGTRNRSNCGAMFSNSGNLNSQIAAVHEGTKKEKSYPCSKCGERFAWASDYLRHNRLVHIQTKINSLYAMLGLEAVKWS